MYLSVAATGDVDFVCIFAFDDDAFVAIALVLVVATVNTNLVDANFGVVVNNIVVANIVVVVVVALVI